MPSSLSQSLQTCSFCPRLCGHACPPAVGEARETLTPNHKMSLVDLWKKTLIPLDHDLAEILYACTNCGACTSLCMHQMTPQDILYHERQEVIAQQLAPKAVTDLQEHYLNTGNPYGTLDEKSYFQNEKLLLLPGCNAYHNARQDIPKLQKALEVATKKYVGVLPSSLCCGNLLFATGDRAHHLTHAKHFAHQINQADTLVVTDPHCAQHLKQHYPLQNISFQPNMTTLLEQLLEYPLQPHPHSPTKVFYHDSSPMGRYAKQYIQPRHTLNALGFDILEFSCNREYAPASGAGGLYSWVSPNGAISAGKALLGEVKQYITNHPDEPSPHVVTIGSTEQFHLLESEPRLSILDLNQLLADAILHNKKNQSDQHSTLSMTL